MTWYDSTLVIHLDSSWKAFFLRRFFMHRSHCLMAGRTKWKKTLSTHETDVAWKLNFIAFLNKHFTAPMESIIIHTSNRDFFWIWHFRLNVNWVKSLWCFTVYFWPTLEPQNSFASQVKHTNCLKSTEYTIQQRCLYIKLSDKNYLQRLHNEQVNSCSLYRECMWSETEVLPSE